VTVRLRGMLAADLPAVFDLERELFPEDAWSREMFADELSATSAGRYYLVAEEDGQLAGYAGLLAPVATRGHGPGGQGDVLTMAVAPSRWGQGIGSALLRALLAEAARRGCAEVFLEVRVDNPRAQQLYRRHGFADVGVRRGYYQPSGTDALVMRRPADPADVTPADRHPAAASPASPAPPPAAPAPVPPAPVPPPAAPASPGPASRAPERPSW
jgi:ribosomal-protein-alanine N-acetyltransferase